MNILITFAVFLSMFFGILILLLSFYPEQFSTFVEYTEYFKNIQPCRTTVEVNALPTPIAIELKCVAEL